MAPQAGVNTILKSFTKQLLKANSRLGVTPFDAPSVTLELARRMIYRVASQYSASVLCSPSFMDYSLLHFIVISNSMGDSALLFLGLRFRL